MNPRAKVILSVRDSAEAWERSASDTIMQSAYNNPFCTGLLYHALKWMPFGIGNRVRLYNMLEAIFNKCAVGHFVPKYQENRVQYYEDWVAHVKRTVSKDRLLVFNVKQGWEPLCKFLNKKVPDFPFPNVNAKGSFQANTAKRRMTLYIALGLVYGPLAWIIVTGRTKSAITTLINWAKNRLLNVPLLSI